MSEAEVSIRREPASGLGDQYPITVWIDGERLGRLLPGDVVCRRVPVGEHVVRVHNTLLSKRVRFESRAGESERFVVANRSNWATFVFGSIGIGPLSVSIEPDPRAPAAPS